MDNNFAIESFIEYCDSMMIANEGKAFRDTIDMTAKLIELEAIIQGHKVKLSKIDSIEEYIEELYTESMLLEDIKDSILKTPTFSTGDRIVNTILKLFAILVGISALYLKTAKLLERVGFLTGSVLAGSLIVMNKRTKIKSKQDALKWVDEMIEFNAKLGAGLAQAKEEGFKTRTQLEEYGKTGVKPF